MTPVQRIRLAAGLCFVALGLAWASTPGSQGYTTSGYIVPGSCYTTADGSMDCSAGTYQAGYYVAGSPEGAARGFEADARVVLVPAVGILLWAARRRTPASVRATWATAAALAVVSVRAAGEGQAAGAFVGAAAAIVLVTVLRGRLPAPAPAGSRPGPVAPLPVPVTATPF